MSNSIYSRPVYVPCECLLCEGSCRTKVYPVGVCPRCRVEARKVAEVYGKGK